jgi:hypothetical protein
MARLSSAARHQLPKSKFAIPEKAPDSGSYPVDTKARARAALSYGARNASPDELSRIKAKVHREYPSIAQKVMRGSARNRKAKTSAA